MERQGSFEEERSELSPGLWGQESTQLAKNEGTLTMEQHLALDLSLLFQGTFLFVLLFVVFEQTHNKQNSRPTENWG